MFSMVLVVVEGGRETVMSGWPILLPLCEAFKTYGGNLVPEK